MTVIDYGGWYNSIYFVPEPDNWHLLPGAPEDMVQEFNEYMERIRQIQRTDDSYELTVLLCRSGKVEEAVAEVMRFWQIPEAEARKEVGVVLEDVTGRKDKRPRTG